MKSRINHMKNDETRVVRAIAYTTAHLCIGHSFDTTIQEPGVEAEYFRERKQRSIHGYSGNGVQMWNMIGEEWITN
jgi:hypothetical protein